MNNSKLCSKPFILQREVTEYLRAIAILAVVVGHILGGKFGLISTDVTAILGIGGVTVFLLLSGYGLYSSYCSNGINGKEYWSKKICKVFIPYAVITIVYFVYMFLRGRSVGLIVLLNNILCIDYTRSIDGTMWYMSFLLIWYLLFFMVFYFRFPKSAKVVLLFLFSTAFVRYWMHDIFGDCSWQFSANAYAFPCGVLLGYLFEKLSVLSSRFKLHNLKKYGKIVLFGICAVLFVCTVMGAVHLEYYQYGIVLFAILYFVFSEIKFSIKPLKWIGRNSFLIYLIEGKLITVMGAVKWFDSKPIVYCLVYAVALVAFVFLYHLVAKLLNKVYRKLFT